LAPDVIDPCAVDPLDMASALCPLDIELELEDCASAKLETAAPTIRANATDFALFNIAPLLMSLNRPALGISHKGKHRRGAQSRGPERDAERTPRGETDAAFGPQAWRAS
jgi:hypothetical protein